MNKNLVKENSGSSMKRFNENQLKNNNKAWFKTIANDSKREISLG